MIRKALPEEPFVYPIVDASLLRGRAVGPLVSALAAAGAPLLQLRAKARSDAAFLALAVEAVEAAHAAGALLLVNDRPDVALLAGADGVHLGQDDLEPAAVRRLLGPDVVIGVSTHSREQLEAALTEPVDYVAVGPVFGTTTKADAEPVVGVDLLRHARARTALPLVAIGGIDAARAGEVIGAGADAVAVIGAIMNADDPVAALGLLRRAVAEGGSRR